jgi:DNA-binding NarL/FixJ family response regulator
VEETTGSGERQTRVQKLASRGMSIKQISEELKTPLGEVELILSLQKYAEN